MSATTTNDIKLVSRKKRYPLKSTLVNDVDKKSAEIIYDEIYSKVPKKSVTFAQFVKDNNDRVNQNPDYYRERQQIIEHQFGTLKRHWHFDYCLTRCKEKVRERPN